MKKTTTIYNVFRKSFDLPGRLGRTLATLCLLLLPLLAFAQSGLRSNSVFNGDIVGRDKMVEVKVRGRAISKYGLTYYHSVRFAANGSQFSTISSLVAQDRRQASSSEERSKGRQRSLILSMPNHGSVHRYLCFLYDGRKNHYNITLVYMEGRVSSIDELRKLIK